MKKPEATATGRAQAAQLLAAVGVMAVALVGCGPAEPMVHGDDRKHPLRMLVGDGGNTLSIPDGVRPGDPWTASFGQFTPCVMTGEGPLTITDVTWAADPGLEPTSVKTWVVTFDGETFAPYPGLIGTPSDPRSPKSWGETGLLEIREDIVGYQATIPCTRFQHRTDPVDEFYIALTTDGGGALVRDLRFHYETPDGEQLILESGWAMGICGPEMPESECPP